MPSTLSSLLTTLGRWPRRLAALACLLLAAASALSSRHPAATARAAAPADVAAAGERAVPVQVAGLDARAYLHPGDHVDLLAGPSDDGAPGDRTAGAMGRATATVSATVVAEDVRVLTVVAPRDGPGSGGLVVAADRAGALRIAALGGRAVVAVARDRP